MKTVFLARSHSSAKVIAHNLLQKDLVDRVIFETGKTAKRKKLRRMLYRRPLWKILLLPLDLFFLAFLNLKADRLFRQKFPLTPEPPIDLWVDDANDEACLAYLRKEKPDIILIHGTSILKDPILRTAKSCVLNIHGGIVPKYRNVHSEFWAVAQQKYNELGSSILITGKGIDSGDIVAQRSLCPPSPPSVSEAKILVFELSLQLVQEVMLNARQGLIPHSPQEEFKGQPPQTPTFLDWLKYRVKL